MKFSFNPAAMLAAFPDAMTGWAGVFVVTLVIIASVWVLNKVTNKNGKEN